MIRILGRIAIYGAILALAALVAMPMYWLLVSAFKASDEIFTATPRWLPATTTQNCPPPSAGSGSPSAE